VIVEQVLPHALIDSASQELRQNRRNDSSRFNAEGKVDFRKVPNLAFQSEEFRAIVCEPGVARVVRWCLGRPALLFRDLMVVKPAPEGPPLDYLQDSAYWDVEPKSLVSVWVPFADVAADNGCLIVIPGSHREEVIHNIEVSKGKALPRFVTSTLRRFASLSGTGDSSAGGYSLFRRMKNTVLGGLTRHLSFLGPPPHLHPP